MKTLCSFTGILLLASMAGSCAREPSPLDPPAAADHYVATRLIGPGPTDGPLDRFEQGLRLDLTLSRTGEALLVSHEPGNDVSYQGSWSLRGDTVIFSGLETEFINGTTEYLQRGDTLRVIERLRRGPLDAIFVKN